MKVKSVEELTKMIAKDKSLEEEIKKDPIKAIARITSPLQWDEWIYRIVVLMLGLTVLLVALGANYLAANPIVDVDDIPEILIAIGSAAVGVLAGLLTPTHGRE